MKLIVGLGNPGEKHEKTRHNAGFMVMERLVGRLGEDLLFSENSKWKSLTARSGDVILVKPLTFMNDSGEAVGKISGFFKIAPSDIYLIHDDLDIVLGDYKIQQGMGPKIHNGVNSVEEHMGNKDFWRVRIGVDGREGDRSIPGDEYVLSNFSREEREVLDKVTEKVVEELMNIVSK